MFVVSGTSVLSVIIVGLDCSIQIFHSADLSI